MLAAQNDHLAIVQELLTAGATVDTFNKYHEDALFYAADRDYADVVQCLLEKGSDPSTIGPDGCTPLQLAAHVGDLAMAEHLLDKGADINAARKKTGLTPLILATAYGHPEVVSLLLSHHADMQKTEQQGHTALFSAITSHHEAIIPLLKAAGAKPSEADSLALLSVVINNRPDLAKQFLDIGVDANYKDPHGFTALLLAASPGRTDAQALPLVQTLIDGGADVNTTNSTGQTSLLAAALSGKAATVRLLLEHRANVNAQIMPIGTTALMLATLRVPFPQDDALGTVTALLAGGARIDAQDARGQTALLQALFGRNADAARLLIAHGANTAIANNDGETPLMIAAEVGLPEIVTTILAKKTGVNKKDKKGRTALAWTHGPVSIESIAFGPPPSSSPPSGGKLFSPNQSLNNASNAQDIDKGRLQAARLLKAAGGKE